MEKQAVVKEGKTPSIVSGKKSTIIINENAFCKTEDDTITKATKDLEASMAYEYNKLRGD